MMGLWSRRPMTGFAYRNHLINMDENGLHETSDGEEFHPPFEHHGQAPHQQYIFPSASHASGLTQTLSFAAGDAEAHTPSVFADSGQLQMADDEERKPAARRAVFASADSFESSHSPPADPEQASLAASMQHHSVDYHQHSSYFPPGFGEYAPPTSPNQEPDLYSHSDQGSLVADAGLGNYAPPEICDARVHPGQYTGVGSSWGAAPTARGPREEGTHSVAGGTKRKEKPGSQKKSTGQKKKQPPSSKHQRPVQQAPPPPTTSTPRRSPRVKSRVNLSPIRSTSAPNVARSARAVLFRNTNEAETVVTFAPSDHEISQCQNNRKLQALENFYSRMNDLAQYHSINGHCNVPQQYEENKKLGVWVNKTRMEKKKFEQGKRSSLTQERIEKLDQIGFYWGTNKGDAKWEEHFSALLDYRREHNNCNVPTKYPKNPALGRFVSTQRCEYKKFRRGEASLVDEAKVERLEDVGFCWDMVNQG